MFNIHQVMTEGTLDQYLSGQQYVVYRLGAYLVYVVTSGPEKHQGSSGIPHRVRYLNKSHTVIRI